MLKLSQTVKAVKPFLRYFSCNVAIVQKFDEFDEQPVSRPFIRVFPTEFFSLNVSSMKPTINL